MPRRREAMLLAVIAALCALPAFGVAGFYTMANLRSLAIDNLPVLLIAAGLTALIISAEIDISVGSQFAVCGVIAGLAAKSGASMPLVVAVTLAAGTLLGAINGLLVAWAGFPAIIATLATMVILRNALIWITGGDWIQNLPPSFQWFHLRQDVAQPLYIAGVLGLFALFAWALWYTSSGRKFYAVGCDHEAARRIGLNPPRIIGWTFALVGACTALAALANFTRYPTIETNSGLGLELKAIAAVVVGGTAITGGRGSPGGTLLGVVLLGLIGTVLTYLHVNPACEKAIQGLIILGAVVADTIQNRRNVACE
jgi:rhamnose transport system permease protein